MGKIKKILENELIGGTQNTDVYPVTSTKAVYDENNENLDSILKRRGTINVSTNYNADHTAEVLTLSQAIAKVPSSDRVLGFTMTFLSSDGWKTYQFIGTTINNWANINNWTSFVNDAQFKSNQDSIIEKLDTKVNTSDIVQQTGDSTTSVMSQKAVSDKLRDLDNKVSTQLPEIEGAKNEALNNIKENEQSAIFNFNAQRVTPEMLSESTKQLIETSGGGTITNLPDDEDLTSVDDGTGNNILKFADRTYNADNFNGKGYKILRKNIQSVNIASTKITITKAPSTDGTLSFTINGKETQIAVSASIDNTTALVIQKVASALQNSMTEYDISIDASFITLTRKSGGSVTPSVFSASTTGVVCTITDSTKREFRNILTQNMINNPNTIYEVRYDFDLDGAKITIPSFSTFLFNGGHIYNGSIKSSGYSEFSKPEWFKNPKLEDWSEAFKLGFQYGKTLILSNRIYDIYNPVTLRVYNCIKGNGISNSTIVSHVNGDYLFYINFDKELNKELSTPFATNVIENLTLCYGTHNWIASEDLVYNENCNAILVYNAIIISNVTFEYFDINLNKPAYYDRTCLINVNGGARSFLKNPNYNPEKNFNFILNNNGDQLLLLNCNDFNCFLRNTNNAVVINPIQVGFYLDNTKISITGYHNEDTIHYKLILINSSICNINTGFFWDNKNGEIPINIKSYSTISLSNILYFNNFLESKIDAPLIDLTGGAAYYSVIINNVFRTIRGISGYGSKGICYKTNKGIYYANGSKDYLDNRISTYLWDLKNKPKEFDTSITSTIKSGLYNYRVYDYIDNDRKILVKGDSYSLNSKQDGIFNYFTLIGGGKSCIIVRSHDNENKYIYVNTPKSGIECLDTGYDVKNIDTWKDFDESSYIIVNKNDDAQSNMSFINLTSELNDYSNLKNGDIININDNLYIKTKNSRIGIAKNYYNIKIDAKQKRLYKIDYYTGYWSIHSFILMISIQGMLYTYEISSRKENDTKFQSIYIKGVKFNGIDFYSKNGSIYLYTDFDVTGYGTEIRRISEEYFKVEIQDNVTIDDSFKICKVYSSYNSLQSTRPQNINVGYIHFDTILKKPIWWTGTGWVDATGTDV